MSATFVGTFWIVTCTAAAKAAIGSTSRTTLGSDRAVNSRKTSADCPSPSSRSNRITARFTQ